MKTASETNTELPVYDVPAPVTHTPTPWVLAMLMRARVHVEDANNYSELASKEEQASARALEVIDAVIKELRS